MSNVTEVGITTGAAILDFTLTINAVEAILPELSSALQGTVVDQIGKKLPDFG